VFQQQVLGPAGQLQAQVGPNSVQLQTQELWAALPGAGTFFIKVGSNICYSSRTPHQLPEFTAESVLPPTIACFAAPRSTKCRVDNPTCCAPSESTCELGLTQLCCAAGGARYRGAWRLAAGSTGCGPGAATQPRPEAIRGCDTAEGEAGNQPRMLLAAAARLQVSIPGMFVQASHSPSNRHSGARTA
jgi:hypothetical protein